MRHLIALAAFAALVSVGDAQDKNADYKEFSRLVHAAVVKRVPKEIEDTSGWGSTIPAEPNLPLPKLRRYVKVGDRLEMPHGTWRRFKSRLEDPDKNLKIVVKDFKKLDASTYRVVTDVDVTVYMHGEIQHWQKGLFLIGGELGADANFTATVVVDVAASLNFQKFPPELKLDPKVSDLTLDFVDFKVRGGPILVGEFGDNVRRDLKDAIRSLVKTSEPLVKMYANDAITQSLRDGKGTISADAILQALPKK